MRWKSVMLASAWAACPLVACGQQYYVSHWGSNVPPYATWETAATNLMDAVDAAADGSTVWVTNGVYRTGSASGGGIQGRVVLTKPIELRSVNGASNTFIEGAIHSAAFPLGASAVRGVYMTDGIMDGFTIRRGHTEGAGDEAAISGGGLYAAGGTQLNIRVIGNRGQTAGGAWLDNCSLSNAVFKMNESEVGPRVKINGGVQMEECLIFNAMLPAPDLMILGTNGVAIVNGDPDMDAGNGAWYDVHHVVTGTATHVFTLTNQGPRPLVLNGVEHQGGHTGDFQLVSIPAGSIQPGETKTMTVRFDPSAKGPRRTLLYVKSNDPDDDPYALWLGGEGIQYELMVLGTNDTWITNGSSVPTTTDGTDFGNCVDRPIRHVFAITNAGIDHLTMTGVPRVAIGGDHPGDFIVVQQPAESIAPGETTAFAIEFYPLVATTRTAEVIIYSDDDYHTNGLYQFSVRGSCSTTNRYVDSFAGLRAAAGSSMAWGDANNDGLLDLAVLGYDGTNRFTDVYRNLGGGSFSNLNAGIVPLESGRLAWGDFDSDGWLDLAVSGMGATSTVTAVYRNLGDGTFEDIRAGLPGVVNGGLAWGDCDNDGDLDLAVSGYTLSTTIARLYRNDGNGNFTYVNHGLLPLQNGRAVWLDVDKSGWLDLIMTGDASTGKTTRLYRNLSGALTNYPLSGLRGSAYGGLSAGDFNNDGWSDLAVTGYGTNGMLSEVYRFGGASSLYTRSAVLAPLWLGGSEWGDLNNDGWLDLVTSGEDASSKRAVNVYENNSGTLALMPSQIPGMRISSVALGDGDGDGDLDVAVSGLSTNGYASAIFRNLSPVSNAPPTAPTGLVATRTNENEIAFQWDAATDDFTRSNSLTYNLYVGTETNPVAVLSPHADLATGRRRMVAMGNAQYSREWRLKNLPTDQRIVWGVQAIDGAYEGGPFAAGDPVDVPALPDLIVSGLQVQNVPFQASVTISNGGTTASTIPVKLSAWLHLPGVTAPCGLSSDVTNEVGVLGVGEATTIVLANLPAITNVVTNTFRVFVNSGCDPDMREVSFDNNQIARVYTNRIYEPFWFRAIPLTNDVFLRWINPTNIGMNSSEVIVRFSTSDYPASTNDGTHVYGGTNRSFHHTGLTSGESSYYTIWVTHDGSVWYEPP